MTKKDLIQSVGAKDVPNADDVVNAVLDTITETLARGDEVAITGFGKFYTGQVNATDPTTGQAIGKVTVVRFKPGAALKHAVR